ncbi:MULTISPECIES: AI-2E family transporter [Bacillus]|uniref:AI-2E family transporter n=1 Tax=Bacillus TaxID=1386 RepID=UPI0021557A44|nr:MULTISPECIES: AI-2E family transporter [Bacillus]MCR6611145.1 AI-2E family transporter [Bacillus infantis]MDT0163328.1 AI-2E family transporter [Bacillus sp. AG4(2022)]
MENWRNIWVKTGAKRIIIFAIILLLLISLHSMINIILLTFIFSFLMDRLTTLLTDKWNLNRPLVVMFLYLVLIGGLTLAAINYLPVISREVTQLIAQLQAFYLHPHENGFINYIVLFIEQNDINKYLEQGFTFLLKYFTDISKIGMQVLISLLLSLFFLLEKKKLIDFTLKFKTSKVAAFYDEIEYFSRKFSMTFGKVIEAQFVIAIVNCLLTTLALWIMDFPQLVALSLMVLVLGLIPVAGVIISMIPLTIIAYSIGGFMLVGYIILVVMVIHAIEAYILNPKLMSSKTELPVFYTFIVLIFSEHFFGIWGLIVGIPVFMFLLDILGVKEIAPKQTKQARVS